MSLFVNKARNVHRILPQALAFIRNHGKEADSRNGPVLRAPYPVVSIYERPEERVEFWETRDSNPFFHFAESLWMLAGRDDVELPARFVKKILDYSDDGQTLHGAYGHRWRQHFGIDQLALAVKRLGEDPTDRRVVLGMWDPTADLRAPGDPMKDLPCNTHAYFSVREGILLDLTVLCRSNDLIWGAHGANAVHFSYLLEYVACFSGYATGFLYQFSNDYHAYLDTFERIGLPVLGSPQGEKCPYEKGLVRPYSLVSLRNDQEAWDGQLRMFLDQGLVVGDWDPFFRRVAHPIFSAHEAYRELPPEERYRTALEILEQCEAQDWGAACRQWVYRRAEAYRRAQDDGPVAEASR